MDKVHEVERVSFRGTTMLLRVDGKDYEVDVSRQSQRLASATLEERKNFLVSPSGYGIHWPDLDEDLSVDGLIGIKHDSPVGENAADKSLKNSINAPV
jgi:hypothetical protein